MRGLDPIHFVASVRDTGSRYQKPGDQQPHRRRKQRHRDRINNGSLKKYCGGVVAWVEVNIVVRQAEAKRRDSRCLRSDEETYIARACFAHRKVAREPGQIPNVAVVKIRRCICNL